MRDKVVAYGTGSFRGKNQQNKPNTGLNKDITLRATIFGQSTI